MKTIIVTTLFLACFALNGCTQNNTKENEIKTITNLEKETEKETVEIGWPKEVQSLIDHLNTWDKDELDAYERPQAYRNFLTSGETNGWIGEHKRKLLELGASVYWNKEKMKYELKKE